MTTEINTFHYITVITHIPHLSHGVIVLKDLNEESIPAKSQNLTSYSYPPVTSRAPDGSRLTAET